MVNTIIIPDVHGRMFWKDALPYIKQGIPTIFLGDYLDPYPFEAPVLSGWDDRGVINNFKEIITIATTYPNVTLLLGNHDLEYWDPHFPACRYMREVDDEIKDIFQKNLSIFKLAHVHNDIVYSHAGISKQWLETIDEDASQYDYTHIVCRLNKMLHDNNRKLLEHLARFGRMRGGWNMHPSMVWIDINEWGIGNIPFTKHQIVGHSLQLTKKETDGGFVWDNGEPVTFSKDHNSVTCVDTREVWYLDEKNELNLLTNV